MANNLMPVRWALRNTKDVLSETDVSAADGHAADDNAAAGRRDGAEGMPTAFVVDTGLGVAGDLAVSTAGVVVTNPVDRSVSIIDPATGTVDGVIDLGGEPVDVVTADSRAFVSLTAAGQDAVAVVDVDELRVSAVYPVASAVTALAVSPDGKRAYAGRSRANRVELTVIDVTAQQLGTIDIGTSLAANIDALRVDPSGKQLYVAVTDAQESQIVVVDAETSQVHRVLPVGPPIRDLECAGSALHVLTSDRADGGTVFTVDLPSGTVVGGAVLGGAPTRLSLSPDLSLAYVVDYDGVTVLRTASWEIADCLTVGARPACAQQYDSQLFVADYAGAISALSVDSDVDWLYSQLLDAEPITVRKPRALQTAGV